MLKEQKLYRSVKIMTFLTKCIPIYLTSSFALIKTFSYASF